MEPGRPGIGVCVFTRTDLYGDKRKEEEIEEVEELGP